MQISDLIEQLQDLQDTHGDLPVYIPESQCGGVELATIATHEYEDNWLDERIEIK